MIVHSGSNIVLITSTSTFISEFFINNGCGIRDTRTHDDGDQVMVVPGVERKIEWPEGRGAGCGAVGWPVMNGETFREEQGGDGVSKALKRKDQVTKERGVSRRRVRGGAPIAGSASRGDGENSRKGQKDIISGEGEMREEADRVANLWVALSAWYTMFVNFFFWIL